jgi:surface polysaccharide O-acyltransferase-like enzyme
VATSRHWGAHQGLSPAVFRRVRRFGTFILLGYALHLPVPRLVQLASATGPQWRAFLAVDVLQLIGVTFLLVQALVLVTRSRRVFTVAALLLAVAALAVTHAVWEVDWSRSLPAWMAAYLSPASGSLFPMFPWASYVLVGAALGQIYVGWGAARLMAYAALVLLVPGAIIAAGGWWVGSWEGTSWSGDPWNFIPVQVSIRVGTCLVLMSAIAVASQRMTRLPQFFAAVAQETLPIYFVHLCIVYGSIWSGGLVQVFGPTLGPWATVTCVVVLLAAMAVLGWSWHWLKQARPRAARWTMAGVAAVLVGRLL